MIVTVVKDIFYMSKQTERANYDNHLVPAETAARIKREGAEFKHVEPESSIDTTAGFTTDQEGLLNNYAIEPEMYVNEPGDLRQQQVAQQEQRKRELKEINQTEEDGKLILGQDNRGKGVGII